MKPFLLSITLTFTLFSCKKNDSPASYPITLIANQYQVIGYPKLYTKSGEITDKAIIFRHLNIPNNFFYFTSDSIITTPNDSIIYRSKDSVTFSRINTDKERIVKPLDGYTYFYMPDTVVSNKRLGVKNEITENIGIFKPYYQEACGQPNNGCPLEYKYDAFIGTGSHQGIELPFMTYRITREFSSVSVQYYNNIFNQSVLNLLQDSDTLAVQTLKRIYKR